jgi:hypothetical protein
MVPVPALSPAEQGIERALLPEIGPMPVDRPVFVAAATAPSITRVAAAGAPRAGAASAYTSRRIKEASIAFDQVLNPDELTPEAIVRAWNHGLIAQN